MEIDSNKCYFLICPMCNEFGNTDSELSTYKYFCRNCKEPFDSSKWRVIKDEYNRALDVYKKDTINKTEKHLKKIGGDKWELLYCPKCIKRSFYSCTSQKKCVCNEPFDTNKWNVYKYKNHGEKMESRIGAWIEASKRVKKSRGDKRQLLFCPKCNYSTYAYEDKKLCGRCKEPFDAHIWLELQEERYIADEASSIEGKYNRSWAWITESTESSSKMCFRCKVKPVKRFGPGSAYCEDCCRNDEKEWEKRLDDLGSPPHHH